MKNKLFPILLCLLLVLSLVPSAMAATLDTADLTIDGDTITIGSGNDEVLAELHKQSRTAKIAVPYARADVYVVKDGTEVVLHDWDKTGFIQFEVPGAGTYVIMTGALGTMEDQFQSDGDTVILSADSNVLTKDHALADGTVIHANNKTIQSTGTAKALSAEGSLIIEDINGVEEILLDTGDKITFDEEGKAAVVPSLDKHVGYGSFQITRKINGKEETQTYFLVEDEVLTISKDGRISGNTTFAPGIEGATTPLYDLQYEDHDNSHKLGKSGSLVAHCNGLFDYYTKVTIKASGSSTAKTLAEKVDGKDVTVSGVKISSGSTVLALESSYLNTLSAGKYILTFHYVDGGMAEDVLHIAEKAGVADPTNPKTGDPVGVLMMVMCGSGTLLAATWYLGKKRHF